MRLKTTTRYRLTPGRMAAANPRAAGGGEDVEKGRGCLWTGTAGRSAAVKNSPQGRQTVQNGTASWPGESASGALSEEIQTTHPTRYTHCDAHGRASRRRRAAGATGASVHGRRVTETRCAHGGILPGQKKGRKLTVGDSRLGLEGAGLSDTGQTEKHKHRTISPTCGIRGTK